MNWKRIWTGAAVAGFTLWVFDFGLLVLNQRILVPEPNLLWKEVFGISTTFLLPDGLAGFLLCWLYALARPRLGPGPKTALCMGSVGFAFASSHYWGLYYWMSAPGATLLEGSAQWLKFAAATYLAGWQYIEKAP